jgi:hippurate hydrolase
MPLPNRLAAFAADMTAWRHHLHAHPELGFDCHGTAAFVAERLRAFGVDEVHAGIAQSGVVAVIRGRGPDRGRRLALRADMDALPMTEETGAPHASRVPGRMHACGHDGHTTMLLGAARYLAETRAFSGSVVLLFQPAEENGGGAGVMVDEGVLDRFGVTEVYGLHNAPGLEAGSFLTAPGPIMAAVDTFDIHVEGAGGHGALPQETRDPIPPAVSIVQAIQTVVSRNNDCADDLVISVTQIHAGTADNVIPATAWINGTVRTYDPPVQDMVERRLGEIVAGQAASFGVRGQLDYQRGYPATINHASQTLFAAEVARQMVGAGMVEAEGRRDMGAEDFAYFLRARPGAFLFLGTGEGPPLHHPHYDFNDGVAAVGAGFFARLVETAQPLR